MTRKKIIIIVAAIVLLLATALTIWDAPRKKVELLLERNAIEQVANAYLQAEIARNYQQIYAYLAPSSDYRKTHSYEEFLSSPVRIQTYRIVDIYRLRNNDNRANYPAVEKFVQVEVDVDIKYADNGEKSAYNYCFTFLKEKGVWYKG
jgi:LPS O-antigen subunit length determinant protein (WzzB/FepE family)